MHLKPLLLVFCTVLISTSYDQAHGAEIDSQASPYSLELIAIPPGNPLSYGDPRELILTMAGAPRQLFWLPFNSQQERLSEYFKSNWPYLNILIPKLPDESRSPFPTDATFRVGHTMVRITGPDQTLFFGATDGNSTEENDLIFNKKIGFEFVWRGVPGGLHGESTAQYSLSLALSLARKPAITKFEITESTYKRLLEFHAAMQSEVQKMPFALGGRPRYREGFGCSSVGEAFVEVGGLLSKSDLDKWKRKLLIPNEIIGSLEKNIQIEVADVVNRKIGTRWAKPTEPHRVLEFIEVEKIYSWMRHWVNVEDDFLPGGWTGYDDWTRARQREGFQYALHIDARWLPTPEEPLFLNP